MFGEPSEETILYWEISELEEKINKMKEAMRWFCERVEKGEVRSKRTYARFKQILTEVR
jgi:hypothetical protein